MNKSAVSSFARGVQASMKKNMPTILTSIAITGGITTTVLAVKATPKALELIEERKKELDVEKLEPVELVKTTWKCYIPAALTGSFSIACAIGANSQHSKRNAALAAAYKLSETAVTEYKDAITEVVGEKKAKQVKEQIDKKHIENNPVSSTQVIVTGKGKSLCYDHWSGRYFESDIETIRRAANNINHELLTGMGYASLNEFYSELKLEPTSAGEDLGWNIIDGQVEVEFSSLIADDGTPAIVIDFKRRPRYGYSSYR